MRTLAAVALALVAAGCARPQWTVVVGTDAQVPQFGDRLLVELLDESGAVCNGCRRQLAAGDPEAWPISFGVVPSGSALSVRARLYRAAVTGSDGLPESDAIIDAVGRLPEPSGITRVALALRMACFGIASDVAGGTTCDPATGRAAPAPTLDGDVASLPEAGTWKPGLPAACPRDPGPDMKCVPGGAFLLGGRGFFPDSQLEDPLPERLVQVSPFALDRDELTVGTFRALAAAHPFVDEPFARDAVDTVGAACTWLGAGDGSNDALPLNCVSFDLASEICAAMGKRLPTEAEWEWAAGNGARETPYSWGQAASSEADLCARGVFGRGREPFELSGNNIENSDCRSDKIAWGPIPADDALAADLNDRNTALGVRDLIGNLNEWVADAVASYSSPCWQGALLVDPRCDTADAGNELRRSIRGSAWDLAPVTAPVVHRNSSLDGSAAATTGLRCARSF